MGVYFLCSSFYPDPSPTGDTRSLIIIIICGANNKMLTCDRITSFPFFQSSIVESVEIKGKWQVIKRYCNLRLSLQEYIHLFTSTYHVINVGRSKCVVPYTGECHITIFI